MENFKDIQELSQARGFGYGYTEIFKKAENGQNKRRDFYFIFQIGN